MTRRAKTGTSDGADLFVYGELDSANRDEVVALVRDALGNGTTNFALDMSGVTFIDCAGLGGILDARRLAAEGGRSLRVIKLSPPVRRLLELTATSEILAGNNPA